MFLYLNDKLFMVVSENKSRNIETKGLLRANREVVTPSDSRAAQSHHKAIRKTLLVGEGLNSRMYIFR